MIELLFHHVLDVVFENEKYRPRRFTQKQTEALGAIDPWFGQTSRTATGVSLKCYTSADTVSFTYSLIYATKRVSSFDVYENGILMYNEALPIKDVMEAQFTYKKKTAGEVLLEILLPSAAEIQLWHLDFGSWKPCDDTQKPLVVWYGDSITQSTSVSMPSMAFPALASRLAGVEYINRGIGSLCYDESVLDENDPVQPDIIMVEFGSNDLVKHDADKKVVYIDDKPQYCTVDDVPALMENARAYLEKIRHIYPDAKIYVMSMLWEYDTCSESQIQASVAYRSALRELVQALSMQFIDGLTLMPHLEQCCVEDRIHLSLFGSISTAQSLVKYLQ